jgi:hypothetical protein
MAVGQPKLEVGPAGDAYEQEADAVAREVVASLRNARSLTALAAEDPRSVGEQDEPSYAMGPGTVKRIGRRAEVGAAGGVLDGDTESAIGAARKGGSPLDPAAATAMGDAFGVDFSNVRVHAGAASTDLNDRVQAKAFTIGTDIFFRDRTPDVRTGEGQELLAHELTHTIQQGATGPARRSHRTRGPGAPSAIQRHASFEHRLLGDVPPRDLFALGAHTELEQQSTAGTVPVQDLAGNQVQVARANVVHILDQELRRLTAWQRADPKPTSMKEFAEKKGEIKQAVEDEAAPAGQATDAHWNVRIVAIPSKRPEGDGPPLLVTYGELNTLADFYGSVEELVAADPVKRRNVVQSVRQQSYEELSKIKASVEGAGAHQPAPVQAAPEQAGVLSSLWSSVTSAASGMATGVASAATTATAPSMFPGAFNISGTGGEVGQMVADKKGGSGTTAYTATLARNACHFAPESWHSWEDHHHKALKLARESYLAGKRRDPKEKTLKLNEALLVNGFGDHYLQDSYAAGHLMNKTKIMQMYVRYLDSNPRWNAGYTSDATWRAFQMMAYNQEGLTDRDQYRKDRIGRRNIGGKQVTTARNPQAVENTQALDDFSWQNRFEMLGLKVPPAATPGTPAWKMLVWMQNQRGGWTSTRYGVNFTLPELKEKARDIGIAGNEVGSAVKSLLDGNIIYTVDETRSQAGTRLNAGATQTGKFTLRKEWVVSATGGNEAKFKAATANTPEAPDAYKKMAQATVYKDYVQFMKDAYLQKATNAAHDYFCEKGLPVASGDNRPLFKIYGDNAMLNAESSKGVKESGITANLSRDSIVETAQTGVEPAAKGTTRILDRLPAYVLPPGAQAGANPISLADWQSRGGALETWLGPNVFEQMNGAINAVMGGTGAIGGLGKITEDENVHGAEAF